MLIKDQLRVRMEQLQMTPMELAKRAGVSAQSVRHWLNGRSFPGKRHAPAVEKALSFRLDFSEGNIPQDVPTVGTMVQQVDIELFLLISKLPPEVRIALTSLVRSFLLAGVSIPQQPHQQQIEDRDQNSRSSAGRRRA